MLTSRFCCKIASAYPSCFFFFSFFFKLEPDLLEKQNKTVTNVVSEKVNVIVNGNSAMPCCLQLSLWGLGLGSVVQLDGLDDGNLAVDFKIMLWDFKNSEIGKKLWRRPKHRKTRAFRQTTSTQYSTLLILGSLIDDSCRKKLLTDKIAKLEKCSEVNDKLEAHYGFYLLKHCFNMLKLLKFCVQVLFFEKKSFWKKNDRKIEIFM